MREAKAAYHRGKFDKPGLSCIHRKAQDCYAIIRQYQHCSLKRQFDWNSMPPLDKARVKPRLLNGRLSSFETWRQKLACLRGDLALMILYNLWMKEDLRSNGRETGSVILFLIDSDWNRQWSCRGVMWFPFYVERSGSVQKHRSLTVFIVPHNDRSHLFQTSPATTVS